MLLMGYMLTYASISVGQLRLFRLRLGRFYKGKLNRDDKIYLVN